LVIIAVQTMPNGGELSLRARQEAGDNVIRVQDTGIGILDKVKLNFSHRSSQLNLKVKA
jgi:signal transduction histidine kinase